MSRLGSLSRREFLQSAGMASAELPLQTRLEAVDPQHADTVALVAGPQVLFAVGESRTTFTREQLLRARKVSSGVWQVGGAKMMSWTALGDQQYTTYLQVG